MAETILIVDDHRDFVFATKLFLESKGYQVLEAYDGLEGLDQAQAHHPDLIVLDVMMPRLDGWATLQVLQGKPETNKIPVLMLTALKEPVNVLTGFDLGCTWFYTKPITDYDDLALVIRRILDSVAAGDKPAE
ncbi:MAG TPA: response regulator [Armatimonadota bacterium]|jgi:CheY-like chemotaxis protein